MTERTVLVSRWTGYRREKQGGPVVVEVVEGDRERHYMDFPVGWNTYDVEDWFEGQGRWCPGVKHVEGKGEEQWYWRVKVWDEHA